ncbi:MAG: hypothetical protein HY859_00545 [Caulobacterales bacterium]|nr:hypothetical protein [Caulobacterales bacterium]
MSISATTRRRIGRTAIVAVSLVAHGVALALLGLTTPALREVRRVNPPAVSLDLWIPAPADQSSQRARPVPSSPPRPRHVASSAPASDIQPLPLAPSRPASPPAATAGVHPAPLPGQAGGDVLRQALRGSPVGCANKDAVGLTRREREACADAYGKRSVETADIAAPLDPARRAEWDAVAARKATIRRRKEGPVPPGINPADNAGGTRTNGIGLLGY